MNVRILDVKVAEDVHSPPIYLEDAGFEEVETCPACDSRGDQLPLATAIGRTKEALSVSHCRRCDHAYLRRRPTREWFQDYYSKDWDTGRSPKYKEGRLPALKRRVRNNTLAKRSVRAAKVLAQDLPKALYPWPARFLHMVAGLGDAEWDEFPRGKKLLEIGAGYGGALGFLKDVGFDTYGTEASAHRVAACRAQGHKVVQTSIDDFGPVKGWAPFDFVFSSHVFEHLTDPVAVMRGLEPLVAPGGFIYIEVPHGPVAEDLVLRTHLPVHCHIFSAASLRALMKRFGFNPVRVLADPNLHIVAQKGPPQFDLGGIRIPSHPSDLVHGLEVAGDAGQPVRIRYEGSRVDITAVNDGKALYSSRLHGTTHRREFVVEVDRGSSDDVWPFRFIHPTDQAPFWVKQQ